MPGSRLSSFDNGIFCLAANLKDFGRVEVIYEILPGWMSDTSKIRQFADLPENARFYVEKIEEIVGVHGNH